MEKSGGEHGRAIGKGIAPEVADATLPRVHGESGGVKTNPNVIRALIAAFISIFEPSHLSSKTY